MTYTGDYLAEVKSIADQLSVAQIEAVIGHLQRIRAQGGRVFVLGVGGGAGNASHAVCDFRKIANLEAYAPTDNVPELTARTNDEGWESSLAGWLRGSRLGKTDAVFVLSVGGGSLEHGISANLVAAVKLAKEVGAAVLGIVGRDGGYTAKVADACVIIPTVSQDRTTPHTEAFQAVVWHLIVSHPQMKVRDMKWESTQ
jgi:D-sedoheptulose 7-phosphate isomerase